MEAEEKLQFAWRVYLPPNHKQIIKYNDEFPLTMERYSASQAHSIARVGIREDYQGRLEFFGSYPGGDARVGPGYGALDDFMRDRWDEVRIEQLGAGGVAVVEPDQPAVLLRLTMPDAMAEEARKRLDAVSVERYVPVLLELKLEPAAPRP